MSLRDLTSSAFAERMRALRRGEAPPVARIDPKTVQRAVPPRAVRDMPKPDESWACVLANVLVIRSALTGLHRRGAGVYEVPPVKAGSKASAGLLLFVLSEDMVERMKPYVESDLYCVDTTTPGRAFLICCLSGEMLDLTNTKPLFAYAMQAHHDLLLRGAWPKPDSVVQLDARAPVAKLVYSQGPQVHYELKPYADSITLPTFVFNLLDSK